MPLMTPIPPALLVHDDCDHCRRSFGWQRGQLAICPNCGLENVRPAQLETAIRPSAAEMAVRNSGRRRRAKKEPS
jgi:hypothetical protein